MLKIIPDADVEGLRFPEKHMQKYCEKDGNWISFGEYSIQGQRTDIQLLVDDIKEGCSRRQLIEAHPDLNVRYGHNVERIFGIMESKPAKSQYTLESCCRHVGLEKLVWFENGEERQHVVYGATNLGKTEYALSHFDKPFLVNDVDNLKYFDKNEFDGIVFDDCPPFFETDRVKSRESQIALADSSQDRAIPCRYFNATIPKWTKKVFITNQENGRIFLDDAAINRRLSFHKVLSQ